MAPKPTVVTVHQVASCIAMVFAPYLSRKGRDDLFAAVPSDSLLAKWIESLNRKLAPDEGEALPDEGKACYFDDFLEFLIPVLRNKNDFEGLDPFTMILALLTRMQNVQPSSINDTLTLGHIIYLVACMRHVSGGDLNILESPRYKEHGECEFMVKSLNELFGGWEWRALLSGYFTCEFVLKGQGGEVPHIFSDSDPPVLQALKELMVELA